MDLINEDDAKRISMAITDAERETSGEIVAVVAESSSTYRYVPFMWAALAALLVPWPFIHFTWMKIQWIYLLQLVVFLALLAALWPQRRRVKFVPRSIRNDYVRRRATEQFLAQNLHTTAGRSGVLIFVSLAERHAEILADKGIHSKVPEGTWQDIVDAMTREIGAGRPADGFINAIKKIGDHLATHFPPGAVDTNELPNRLIVLTS